LFEIARGKMRNKDVVGFGAAVEIMMVIETESDVVPVNSHHPTRPSL
jgi:hypothetical protein